VWTIHDGRVHSVKYKGNDHRANSVPKKRHGRRTRAEVWTPATNSITLYCTWHQSALTIEPHGQVIDVCQTDIFDFGICFVKVVQLIICIYDWIQLCIWCILEDELFWFDLQILKPGNHLLLATWKRYLLDLTFEEIVFKCEYDIWHYLKLQV